MPKTALARIAAAFAARPQSALMPYFTLGYPDRATSLDIITAIAAHSDLLELGVPFSDPLADGATIQRSTQQALENGTTTIDCLAMVNELRQRGVTIPIMLMGYYNPVLAYGIEAYVTAAAEAGADGFIIPDLPPEEALELETAANDAGLALIHFLAPTSNQSRIDAVIARARGFIYMVSVTGVTGARSKMQSGLASFVNQIKEKATVPVAVGFGISTPKQAGSIAAYADGIIVGSALINAVDAAPEGEQAAAAATFVKQLRAAI